MKKNKNNGFKLEIVDESHLEQEGAGTVMELEQAEQEAIKKQRIVAYR